MFGERNLKFGCVNSPVRASLLFRVSQNKTPPCLGMQKLHWRQLILVGNRSDVCREIEDLTLHPASRKSNPLQFQSLLAGEGAGSRRIEAQFN